MGTTVSEQVNEILAAAEAALLKPEKFAELTADPPAMPSAVRPERRSALMKLIERRANVQALSDTLGKAWAPFVEAGRHGTMSMAETAIKRQLEAQRDQCATFIIQTAVEAGTLPACVPSNITRAKEVLRGLAPIIRDKSIAEALTEIGRLRNDASWQELTDWTFELTVKL